MLFIEYPKCSTCKNAKKYLEEKKIEFIDRDITKQTPTVEELTKWISKYQIDIKRLFNTSGLVYKDLQLKDKLNDMTEEEKIKLLSSNGMLIKRPLLISDEEIKIGFKIKEWDNLLGEDNE